MSFILFTNTFVFVVTMAARIESEYNRLAGRLVRLFDLKIGMFLNGEDLFNSMNPELTAPTYTGYT
jgi:hypothetical protein